jgi:O-antigen/teichoic acid export membrane protein
VALFLNRGLWALAVSLLMLRYETLRNLDMVFASWVAGSVGAVLASLWFLRMHSWRDVSVAVDRAWIRRGLAVASVFLLASLFLQGMFTIDRYIVERAGGLDLVGVYTFYMGIAMSAMAFLDAGVFAFLYPRVVSAFKTGTPAEFRIEMRRLLVRTGTATAATIGATAVAVPVVLHFLERPIYQANVGVFWLLLAAVSIYALGMVPHFGLYAMEKDRSIVLSQGAGLFAFLAVALPASTVAPLAGVGAGLLTGATVIGLSKTWRYLSLRPAHH